MTSTANGRTRSGASRPSSTRSPRRPWQQAGRAVDKNKLAQLTASEAAARKNVSANQQKVDELQAKLKDADNALFRATTAYQTMKATYDQDRYDFEASRANGLSSAAKKGEVAADEAKQLSVLDLAREKAEADKADVQKQLGQYTGQVATVQKSIDEITAEQTRLKKRLDVIAPSAVKDYFRNAPLLDFLAPTLKIQQIILPNVVDDVNFIHVPKMDRCQTCHLAIDKKGYEKYPQPFTTHPGPGDLSRRQLVASDRQDRLHRLPRRHGPVGQLPRRGPHAVEREAEGRVGEEIRLGAAAPVGLPDAADRR